MKSSYSLLLAFIFVFILFGCGAISIQRPPLDCTRFKTGHFRYADMPLSKIAVLRNDSEQIESTDTSRIVMKLKWTDQQSFWLLLKPGKNRSYYNNRLKDTLFVHIIEFLNDSTYRYEAKMKMLESGYNWTTSYTVVKQKDL